MKRYSKKEVRYTDDHGSSNQQCSKCYYYATSTECDIVVGQINPAGWCNKFKRSPARTLESRLEGVPL